MKQDTHPNFYTPQSANRNKLVENPLEDGQIMRSDKSTQPKTEQVIGEISLCQSCFCMTQTINRKCGKCEKGKDSSSVGEGFKPKVWKAKDQITGLKNEIEELEFQLVELQSRYATLLKQFFDLKEQIAEKDKLLAECVPKEKKEPEPIENILLRNKYRLLGREK